MNSFTVSSGRNQTGRLKPHEKMPSKRKLAAHLKISVVTVEGAYAQLTAKDTSTLCRAVDLCSNWSIS
jgi:DNA-binding transcriptional regulator YhcF (GntR family)